MIGSTGITRSAGSRTLVRSSPRIIVRRKRRLRGVSDAEGHHEIAECLCSPPTVAARPVSGRGICGESGLREPPVTLDGAVGFDRFRRKFAHPKVITSCPDLAGAITDTYNPKNGYRYVGEGSAPAEILVVKPFCHVIKTIPSSRPLLSEWVDGFVFDPLTDEMVAFDAGGLAYVLQGTSLVDTVSLGAPSLHCPSLGSWDSALSTIAVADYCGGGVDLLYLSEVNGTPKGTTVLEAFDHGNQPEGVLDAGGYIFAAGYLIDVFDQRTLAYLGSFGLGVIPTGYLTELAWDALNHTVVIATAFDFSSQSRDAVYFLHIDSIRTHAFSFGRLPIHDILNNGAGGVAYSAANGDP